MTIPSNDHERPLSPLSRALRPDDETRITASSTDDTDLHIKGYPLPLEQLLRSNGYGEEDEEEVFAMDGIVEEVLAVDETAEGYVADGAGGSHFMIQG